MNVVRKIFVTVIVLSVAATVKAQPFNYKLDGPFAVTKTFKVNGNCIMCKHRIEDALAHQRGIWSAQWDRSSKTILVKYDKIKMNPDKIQQLIAAAGHDTEKFKAPDEAYANLPECCRYSREN